MIAAGGGGANNRNSKPTCGYGEGSGGYGGGLIGGDGETKNHTISGCTYGWGQGMGATQTSGGYYNNYNSSGALTGSQLAGAFGTANGSLSAQSGGGGGYYGGSLGGHGGAGGGSSFISGYSGCDAINASGNHTGQPNHYSGYVFTNSVMIAGNEEMTSPTGDVEIGHTGNGYARITYLP